MSADPPAAAAAEPPRRSPADLIRANAACKNLPWAEVPAHTAVTSGHGRRARRTIKVVTAPRGSASPARDRSLRSAAPSPEPAARASRSSTSSSPPTTSRHRQPPSPPGSKDIGALRTGCNPRRHLRRGPLPSPHRQQPARDGHPAQHRDQPAPTCRLLDQHRRRPTTSRQTPRRHRPTSPGLLKRDFAGPWSTGLRPLPLPLSRAESDAEPSAGPGKLTASRRAGHRHHFRLGGTLLPLARAPVPRREAPLHSRSPRPVSGCRR